MSEHRATPPADAADHPDSAGASAEGAAEGVASEGGAAVEATPDAVSGATFADEAAPQGETEGSKADNGEEEPEGDEARGGDGGPEGEGEEEGGDFWRAVGSGLLTAGKVIGRGAMAAGAVVRQGYEAIDPDVRRTVAQAPLMVLTHLSPSQPRDIELTDDGRRLVVFVHGLGGHRGNFLPMSSYFRVMGRARAISVGFADADTIEARAGQLASFVLGLVEHLGLPEGPVVDLVCHSMGGIIARAALEDPAFRARAARLLTLGTPHQGTHLARLAQTALTLDLRPGSPLLERLTAQLPWREDLPPLTCLWSPSDVVIMPPEAATVEGATNVRMDEFTHLSFLLHPRSWRAVMDALEPSALR